MAFAVSPAKRAALRALAEGASPTLALLADASGCRLDTVERLAERYEWKWAGADGGDVVRRVRVAAGDLLVRMEALGRKAIAEGGRIDRAEIDGIVAVIRGLDKIGEIMRPGEAAKENQISHDEELAALLERIDRRIVGLARELAAQVAAGECGLRGSGEGAPCLGA